MNTVALIDSNNVVVRVIVIPESQVFRFKQYMEELNLPGNWLLCDPLAYRGKNRKNKNEVAFRKNYPMKGYVYDKKTDSFLEPKPAEYPSWVLDEDGGFWKPPVPRPIPTPTMRVKYRWDEPTVSWVPIN